MRTIKFRGIRIDTGGWVYGGFYEDEFATYIIKEVGFLSKPNDVNGPAEYDSRLEFFEVEAITVGQYIGKIDRNGVEIYENDIFEGRYSNSVVQYKEMFNCGCCTMDSGIGFDLNSNKIEEEIKIVGNVFENLELL